MSTFVPVVLSGGSGTRLWPVSRKAYPKQFCDLFGGKSLYERTLARLRPLGTPWTITTQDLKVLTDRALKAAGFERTDVLFEPMGRNTAPAIGLLCRVLELRGQASAVAGVFPADQLIENESAFHTAVREAIVWAERGDVVTLGLTPTYPATGYGYIETTSDVAMASAVKGATARKAVRFREKPNAATAAEFIKAGGFFWNAGMFVFKVQTMIDLLKQNAQGVWAPLAELKSDLSNLKECYARVQAISIDYAVMEKLASHVTIPCPFDWSDVGSWDAIAEVSGKSAGVAAGGTIEAAPIEVNARGNFVFRASAGTGLDVERAIRNGKSGPGSAAPATTQKTVAITGVDDLVVVETTDALLIAKKGTSEKVKDVVERLVATPAAHRATQHDFDIRPWGGFEVLRDTERFKSKVLTVNPGAQISYQSHAKRAEHWIITAGSGEVVLDDKVIPVQTGSHVFIPIGAKHRIRNTGNEMIEFVEVQLGSYFGEDDIVRYEDSYGRS